MVAFLLRTVNTAEPA